MGKWSEFRQPISKEILEKLYIEDKLSTPEIAKKLGYSSANSIKRKMQKFNIKRRSMSETQNLKWIYRKFIINNEVKDFIDGSLLGDGGVYRRNPNGNCYYNQVVAEKDYTFINFVSSFFNKYNIKHKITFKDSKLNGKIFKQYCLTTLLYVDFNTFRENWYKNKIKIVPKDINFSPLTIAMWYIGDGSLRKRGNCYDVRIATDGFTKDEVEFLSKSLDSKLDIKSHLLKTGENKQGNMRYGIRICADDTTKFLNYISEFKEIMPRKWKST